MDAENTLDQEIAPEIERLRSQFTDTQELYREVCVLLFFRHGITPTANKLYQLVRRGSMSAPASALRTFWEDLRDKSRIRIEHPDLPVSLKEAAGELVATLWTEAQASAHQSLAAFRESASESIRMAQTAQKIADADRLAIEKLLDDLREQLETTRERSFQLELDLSSEKTSTESLKTQLIAAAEKQKALESSLIEARRDFASELEKQRQALERSEERLQASEKRSLLEIDHERQGSARLQREMQGLRQTLQETNERHLAETTGFQKRVEELNQNLGVLEGKLQSQRETGAELTAQLALLRQLIGERETKIALLEQTQELSSAEVGRLQVELASILDRRSIHQPKAAKKKRASP